MAITAHLDSLQQVSMSEMGSLPLTATRAVIVEWVAGDLGATTDARQLAQLALKSGTDVPNLPQPGDALDSTVAGYDQLIVVQRDFNALSTNKCSARCLYRFVNDTFNAPFFVRPSNTLVQVSTNKDGDGDTLLDVAYVQDGTTKTQVGEISALSPQPGWSMEISATLGPNSPFDVVDDWIGKINDDVYLGFAAEYVLCTGCNWSRLDARPGSSKYIFDFEFLVAPIAKRHQPEVMWRDPTQGRVPPDVSESPASEGNPPGRKYADWHPKRNFNVTSVI